MLKKKLRMISQEIAKEMKAQGIWSAQRDDSHPQISTPPDWVQWDYLPSALAAIDDDKLPEAYGELRIFDYIGGEFPETKYDRFRQLLLDWDLHFAEFAAPILAKIPKLYEKVFLDWEVSVADVNAAFDKEFTHIQKSLKLPGCKMGQVPMEVLREKYTSRVRDQIIMPLVQEQMRKAMSSKGYIFEEFYPLAHYEIENLKVDTPFVLRLEFSVPVQAQKQK